MAEKRLYHDNHTVQAGYKPIPWLLKVIFVTVPLWAVLYFALNYNAVLMHDVRSQDNDPHLVIAIGKELAAEQGCFTCHGPEGKGGVENPGHPDGRVPGWNDKDLASNNMVFPIVLRQQIERAVVFSMYQDPADIGGQEFAALKMQPWIGRLSTQQINYIMAYIYSINPFLQDKMRDVLAGRYDTKGFSEASGDINPAYVGFSYGEVWRQDGTPLGPPATADFPPGKNYPEDYDKYSGQHKNDNPPQWTRDVKDFARIIGLR
ncbi:c-type cytochrome [Anaeroselena agilis]|uniref:C-type cytochrome n=1 Tax=Anaeroselena agilis TaxID=3063788 RepID=A0ABU3P005_9FIRM|nr:c-type cytochrome [Selenomonadales bacterium 4137-cl]